MIPNIGTEVGSEMRNIINTLIDVVNGQSSALQDLVAEGQLTEEQYQNLLIVLNGLIKRGEVTVSDINLNLGKIGLAHLSDEVIKAIAGTASVNAVPADGSIVTQKIAPLAVTPEKTTFFEVGKNKFNYKDVILDKYLNEANGNLIDLAGFVTSRKIPVRAGQDIAINNARKIIYWDINNNYITGLNNSTSIYTGKAPKDGYIQFSINGNTVDYKNVQLEFNNSVTSFENYSIKPSNALNFESIVIGNNSDYIVTKDGNNINLSTYLDNKKLEIRTIKNGSSNGGFTFNGDYLDGTLIHSTVDDITPIRPAGDVVGANHGYTCIVDLPNSDKTKADLGSQWTDGKTTYVLLRIANNRLILGCPYSESNGYVETSRVAPTANLTHVSGATNTTSISISGIVANSQLYPSTARIKVAYSVDGQEIKEDKTYKGNKVTVSESYDILCYKEILEWSKSNVGKDYADYKDNLSGMVSMFNTFEFYDRGKCNVSTSFKILKTVYFNNTGTLQSVKLMHPSWKVMRYVPNVKNTGGVDFAKPFDLSTYNSNVYITKSDLIDSTKAVNRYVDYLVNGSTTELAFTMGYIHDKTDGKDSSRLENTTNIWNFRDSKKSYPNVIEKKIYNAGDYLYFQGYRNYFIPKNKALIENYVTDAESTYFIVDELLRSSFSSADFRKFIGKTVVPTESKGIEIKNNVIDSLGLNYSVTEPLAYFIAKSNKQVI